MSLLEILPVATIPQMIPGASFLRWVQDAMRLTSLSSLLVLVSSLLIFCGACYLVASRRQSSVLAAYLVFLPLPIVISMYFATSGVVTSLNAIASTPGVSLTTDAVAAATAQLLGEVLFAVLINAPSYFVLAIGLFLRTFNSAGNSTSPARSHSERHSPLLGSDGTLAAAK